MGLPTPNLFAGGHEFHSVREWASVQDMAAAARDDRAAGGRVGRRGRRRDLTQASVSRGRRSVP